MALPFLPSFLSSVNDDLGMELLLCEGGNCFLWLRGVITHSNRKNITKKMRNSVPYLIVVFYNMIAAQEFPD